MYEKKDDCNEYIAPNLYRSRLKKDHEIKQLYDLKYILVTKNGKKPIAILSDTENIASGTIRKSILYRQHLVKNRTTSEESARLLFKQYKQIQCLFQKAFYICDSLYFADFYLPKFKTIIEIDGGYHNTSIQKKKDKKRTRFLESVGIRVIRISNAEAENSMIISQTLLTLIRQSKY